LYFVKKERERAAQNRGRMNKQNKKPKGRAGIRTFKILLFLFLLGLCVLLLGAMYQTKEQDHKQKEQQEELQQEKDKKGIKKLQKKYQDMVGWIEIKDTEFAYPVMQTKENPEYYLHKDVWGNYSFYGTPFLDYRCSVDSDNRIIYGHNINGRRYFGYLQNYREASFYQSHPTIIFTKVNESKEMYHIISVIKTDIYADYYKFTDCDNDEEYRDYVQEIIANSLYPCKRTDSMKKEMKEDTVEAFFHRYQFLTLSTCRTGEGRDARLLVIACRNNTKQEEQSE
jgi:sortase B